MTDPHVLGTRQHNIVTTILELFQIRLSRQRETNGAAATVFLQASSSSSRQTNRVKASKCTRFRQSSSVNRNSCYSCLFSPSLIS